MGAAVQDDINNKLDQILNEVRYSRMEKEFQDLQKMQEEMMKRISNLESVVPLKVNSVNQTKSRDAGVTYKRWGRSSCSGNRSDIVYEGFAAGGHYRHPGASPEMLCLPRDPEWGKYSDKSEGPSNYIYVAEYEIEDGRDVTLFGKSIHQQDIPCAVCEARNRNTKIMIPARKTCYDGWTREYWGYLMSSQYEHAQQKNIYCVDAEPEFLTGGADNTNGYILYLVEIRRGGNICPPYVDGRELTCVVCTK